MSCDYTLNSDGTKTYHGKVKFTGASRVKAKKMNQQVNQGVDFSNVLKTQQTDPRHKQ